MHMSSASRSVRRERVIFWRSVSPSTYSVMMKREESASPISWIVMMFGWFKDERSCLLDEAAHPLVFCQLGGEHLTATARSSSVLSRAR